jgi:hypothetical protein
MCVVHKIHGDIASKPWAGEPSQHLLLVVKPMFGEAKAG